MFDPGVNVIVVNYRTPLCLERFLESYLKYLPAVAADLTVYNVAPEDQDRKVVAGYGCRYLESSRNVGYNIAVNGSAACGNREVIAIFNADVVLTENAIDECADALLANPEWGALGPRQFDVDGLITHAGMFGTNDDTKPRGWHSRDDGTYGDVRDDAVTLSGAAIFYRRSAWNELTACHSFRHVASEALGAFLPTNHYYGETYANYHLRAHGYKCAYYGPVRIRHDWHQSSPIGGWGEQQLPVDQAYFRRACAIHGILTD